MLKIEIIITIFIVVDTLLAIVACVSLKGQTNKETKVLRVIFARLTLSFLRVKTPAEEINDNMEKGEMVVEDRELTVGDEERIKSELIRLVTL